VEERPKFEKDLYTTSADRVGTEKQKALKDVVHQTQPETKPVRKEKKKKSRRRE